MNRRVYERLLALIEEALSRGRCDCWSSVRGPFRAAVVKAEARSRGAQPRRVTEGYVAEGYVPHVERSLETECWGSPRPANAGAVPDRQMLGQYKLAAPASRSSRASVRLLVVCVRPAGARVERGSGARGATDRPREEEEEKPTTARERPCSTAAARTTRMNARRARRERVTRRSARAAPSLRTERRVKRRRETRTTKGDRTRRRGREEDHHSARRPRANCGGENHPLAFSPDKKRP